MTPSSIVLLSGPIAVGKSSVASELVGAHGFHSIRTSQFLVALATSSGTGTSRSDLQELGDEFDRKTDFRWVIDRVAVPAFRANPQVHRWLVDSVRKRAQVAHFRESFREGVLHVHFTAPECILEPRYESRRMQLQESGAEQPSYTAAIAHANEVAARELHAAADLVVDLSQVCARDAALVIVHRLEGSAECVR